MQRAYPRPDVNQRAWPRRLGVPRMPGSPNGAWPVATGVALAALAGLAVGGGGLAPALLLVAVPVFVIVATATPERTALGLIVVLPFLVYPLSSGRFSLFLAIPLFGYASIMLLARHSRAIPVLARTLPVRVYAILVAIAALTAAVSSDPTTAFTRVAYLALFGVFAGSVAAALVTGRLSRDTLVKAVVVAGAVAAVAVVVQFAAQFGAGRDSVIDWLNGVHTLFAGERGAAIGGTNWVLSDPVLLRGVFPFMSPSSAGQFLMLALVAAVWLRRESGGRRAVGSLVELALITVLTVGLLATFSRQAWLGAAAGVFALGLRRRPVWTLGAAITLLVAVAVVPIPGAQGSFGQYLLDSSAPTPGTSSGVRVGLWSQALDLMPDHAVVGVGPGLFGTLNPNPSNPVYYAHNAFLDAAVEIGIAGALALLAVFLLAMRTALARRATLAFGMLTAFFVASLFDDVLYFPKNGLLLAVAFALLVAADVPAGSDEGSLKRPEDESGHRPPSSAPPAHAAQGPSG